MGRPREAPAPVKARKKRQPGLKRAKRKGRNINIRVNDDEYAMLQAAAEKGETTVSGVVLALARSYLQMLEVEGVEGAGPPDGPPVDPPEPEA